MNKVWARVGVNILLTDKEISKLSNYIKDNDSKNISELLRNHLKAGYFSFDGESYIPGDCASEARLGTESDVEFNV